MTSSRQEYIDKLHAQIDQAAAELDRLEAKARESEADAKIRIQEEIDALQDKRTDAKQELTRLKQSSDAAWQDIKRGVESAWRNLADGVERATKQFS